MAEREHARQIGEYRDGVKLLDSALVRIPRGMWDWRSEDDPWTIHDHVLHIADSEANFYIRMRKAIAQPEARVDAYDQDAWQASGMYAHEQPEFGQQLFAIMRLQTASVLESLLPDVWEQAIEHPEIGRQTLADLVDDANQHLEGHLAQIEAIHDAWLQSRQ